MMVHAFPQNTGQNIVVHSNAQIEGFSFCFEMEFN